MGNQEARNHTTLGAKRRPSWRVQVSEALCGFAAAVTCWLMKKEAFEQ